MSNVEHKSRTRLISTDDNTCELSEKKLVLRRSKAGQKKFEARDINPEKAAGITPANYRTCNIEPALVEYDEVTTDYATAIQLYYEYSSHRHQTELIPCWMFEVEYPLDGKLVLTADTFVLAAERYLPPVVEITEPQNLQHLIMETPSISTARWALDLEHHPIPTIGSPALTDCCPHRTGCRCTKQPIKAIVDLGK